MKSVALHGINAARAISCLQIVYYHVTEFLDANGLPNWYPVHTPGLHLFIVISGFMLVYTTHEKDTGTRFLVKRLGRIVPLYWTLTLGVIALALFRDWLYPGIDLSLRGIASSFLFVPSANLAGAIQPNLFTGWTLNYIVLSYVLFAASMFAPFKYRPYVAIGLLAGFVLLANEAPDPAMRRFWTDPFFLELVFGMFAAVLVRQKAVLQWASRHSMWPLIIISGAVMMITVAAPMTEIERAFACGFSTGAFVLGLALRDIQRRAVKEGPLQPVARLGYSIYLVHPLVVPLVGLAIAGRLGSSELEVFTIVVASFLGTFIAASFTQRFVEEPAAAWIDKLMKRGRQPGSRRPAIEKPAEAAVIGLKDG